MSDYAERRAALAAQLRSAADQADHGTPVRLRKATSNLFRDRSEGARHHLDVRAFDHVIAVDAQAGWVDTEGMVTYERLTDATLAHGTMPCVVPQLKSITIGGAVAGIGIEASSFRYGLVHETVLELDVLLADGDVVTARPDNEHSDLFFGFPNSYGTLGYALRVRAATRPVRSFVQVQHRRFDAPERFFEALARACDSDADFVDGVVFGRGELVLSIAHFVDRAPWVSDYTYERIYYQSLRERDRDFLSARDYIWRWDTDWFWCSRNLGAQNPIVRRLLGRARLNSTFYTRVMRWNSAHGITRALDRLRGRHPESVIQDVDIPIDRAGAFLAFLLREIGILPVWICPFRSSPQRHWPLFATRGDTLYVNFGFWDVVRARAPHRAGHFNRLIEREVQSLGGIKSLYSDAYFPPEEFWAIYDATTYGRLKARYDPRSVFPDLYQKTVLRH